MSLIGENACMSLALRKRCHNMLLESKWKLKYLSKQYRNKLCEINFFPLVHKVGEVPMQSGQKLECRGDAEGEFYNVHQILETKSIAIILTLLAYEIQITKDIIITPPVNLFQ